MIQFWVGVVLMDVQARTRATSTIALAIDAKGTRVEQSSIPLGFEGPKAVLYMQRFFLIPGAYTLLVDVDGRKSTVPLRELSGEAFEELAGEVKIALLPDPRSDHAKSRILSRQ